MNDREKFEKFTERARKVVNLAHEEAERFRHNYIGTEHLLLGLVREGEGIAAKVLGTPKALGTLKVVPPGLSSLSTSWDDQLIWNPLANLGVELNKVRSAIESLVGRRDRIVLGEIGLTPHAKKVIDLAIDEAHHLNHHYISTHHLLLGLIRDSEGTATRVLESLGVNLEEVRMQTLLVLSQVSTAS